jgi:hypothetical protein
MRRSSRAVLRLSSLWLIVICAACDQDLAKKERQDEEACTQKARQDEKKPDAITFQSSKNECMSAKGWRAVPTDTGTTYQLKDAKPSSPTS